jgi:hypothetical protein
MGCRAGDDVGYSFPFEFQLYSVLLPKCFKTKFKDLRAKADERFQRSYCTVRTVLRKEAGSALDSLGKLLALLAAASSSTFLWYESQEYGVEKTGSVTERYCNCFTSKGE